MSPAVSHEHANSLAWRSRGETPWTVARVDPDAQPVRIPSTADSPSEVRLAGYQPTELPAARADDVGNSPDAKTNPDDPAPKAAVPQVTVPEVVTGSRPMADPASRPVRELENKAPFVAATPEPLALRRVVESVYTSFPAMEAALREFDIAAGKQQAAWGEFELKLKAESISQPEG